MDSTTYNGQERRTVTPCIHIDKIVDLDHAINGNGRVGLRVDVARISATVDITLDRINELIMQIGDLKKLRAAEVKEATIARRAQTKWIIGTILVIISTLTAIYAVCAT